MQLAGAAELHQEADHFVAELVELAGKLVGIGAAGGFVFAAEQFRARVDQGLFYDVEGLVEPGSLFLIVDAGLERRSQRQGVAEDAAGFVERQIVDIVAEVAQAVHLREEDVHGHAGGPGLGHLTDNRANAFGASGKRGGGLGFTELAGVHAHNQSAGRLGGGTQQISPSGGAHRGGQAGHAAGLG